MNVMVVQNERGVAEQKDKLQIKEVILPPCGDGQREKV